MHCILPLFLKGGLEDELVSRNHRTAELDPIQRHQERQLADVFRPFQEEDARELREEMGIEVQVNEKAMQVHHQYPHYDIDFTVFRCQLRSAESDIRHIRVHDHRWVKLAQMGEYQFPDADARTLEKLLDLDH